MDAATQSRRHRHLPQKDGVLAPQSGWAEQHPESWWQNVKAATPKSGRRQGRPVDVAAIGITYQMHGLVCVDKNKTSSAPRSSGATAARRRRPSAAEKIGLTMPRPPPQLSGNFTAKLGWVKQNEPDV